MDFLAAALLGVVQGLTEFLPVSSSAHLVLARAFFGWNVDEGAFGLAFDVALHAGTLVAILIYFRRDIAVMLAAVPEVLSANRGPGKVGRLIVIGTIPMVVIGLLLAGWLEDHARTPAVIAVTLALGGVWLLAAERFGARTREEDALTAGGALLVGTAQAAALVPGMSRSGSTISMAMLLGLTRESAARFSFLLGIPAIGAAAAKEGVHLLKTGMTLHDAQLFALGMAVSALVGFLTIKFFLKYLTGHSLNVFAYYRLALAAVTVGWLLTR
ncbi:MAG TPA: undecaprenyl-diphosphate phosphatase [Vicinamibacterales bacterium]|nr:undecaprenyl-diphosphate phosphatase [Vicinamibacterales bacterium]